MGIGICRYCPGKMGFKPHWNWDLVTGNGKKIRMGFENCEVGFGKKNELRNGIGNLPSGPSRQS